MKKALTIKYLCRGDNFARDFESDNDLKKFLLDILKSYALIDDENFLSALMVHSDGTMPDKTWDTEHLCDFISDIDDLVQYEVFNKVN